MKLIADFREYASARLKIAEDERDAARDRANGWHDKLTEEVRLRIQTERKVDELKHDIGRRIGITTELSNQVSKLESELRSEKEITACYMRASARRLKRIVELEEKLATIDGVLNP